jgi:DNA polymerase-3 subunit alpha
MYLFIDTETNGLPNMTNIRYGDYPLYTNINKYDTARVIQLSFMLCDKNLNEIEMHDYIIKRENYEINNYEFHNITNEISDKGYDFNYVINILMKTLEKCQYIIAHNINFDINVIRSEFYRRNNIDYIKEINKYKQICTVKQFKYIVNAKNKYDKIKDPSLKELFHFAFNKELECAHNSKYDVINLHKAVKYFYDNKVIKELK